MNSISTQKQRLEQQLQTIRHTNIELMKVKLEKKKIDLNGKFDKNNIHNILNSLLQGDVFDEDLLNQFWSYYFQKSVGMGDFMKAYSNTIIILIEKITLNNNRISELTREREVLKQNHNYKRINLVNTDLEALADDNRQFQADLAEYSKPFQFHFQALIEKHNVEFQNSLRAQAEFQDKENIVNKNKNVLIDFLIGFNTEEAKPQRQQQQEQPQLTEKQKFYRFIVYLACITFVLQVCMVFNKYNFVDLFFGFLFLINTLQENYLLKNDLINRVMNKIEINILQDKMMLKDVLTEFDLKKLETSEIKQVNHNFQNYVNSSVVPLAILIIWDAIWLILSYQPYYNCESHGYSSQTSCSFWRFNRYIIYASIFTFAAKVASFIFMFQVASITPEKIFTRHNYSILTLRLTSYESVINQLTDLKK